MLVSNFEIYPDKSQYRPGETGAITLEFDAEEPGVVEIRTVFFRLVNPEWEECRVVEVNPGHNTYRVSFCACDCTWECFGVEVSLAFQGMVIARAETAFDVADHWRRAPRYGFLSDFAPEELGKLNDIEALVRFHINVVQFYDWMYRHDDLIPPTEEFVDPMGRCLSYSAVRERILALHERGAAAMAYGAVYASLEDFARTHPEWGLYKRTGKPHELIGTFYIMDISPGSDWSKHIVREYRRAIEAGFDGIHMDQYGFPKKAVRLRGGREEVVDLAGCYRKLIDTAKQALQEINPDVGLIFNNVSNYPVYETAGADQDAVYIEVWAPYVYLRDLKALIDRGRELGRGKHVILAAYLPAFRSEAIPREAAENGALLTMATIFASGGYHLLLGEDNRVLTEAYYPSHAPMRAEFVTRVRRYYDFIVRYGKLLFADDLLDVSMAYTGGINTEVVFAGDATFAPNGELGTVWTMVKQSPTHKVINLINLVGLEDDRWNTGKLSPPVRQEGIVCRVLADRAVRGVYLASPDLESIQPRQLAFRTVDHEQGEAIEFVVPSLDYWDMVFIEEG